MTNATQNQISDYNARMIQMLGATPEQIDTLVEKIWDEEKVFNDKDKRTVVTEIAISILSDAQELLDGDQNAIAIRMINRAKWMMMEYVSINKR